MYSKIVLSLMCVAVFHFIVSTTAQADLVLSTGTPTGQWYNADRDGEGFYVEIINNGGVEQIYVAMFTMDGDGNQMWMNGNIPIGASDTNAAVPVIRVDGAMWGPDFDENDINIVPFGTITVRFPSCDTALFQIVTEDNVGLANGSYSLVRLTSIVGISCINPPVNEITSGTWRGNDVCFNVSENGLALTGLGSECALGAAFDAHLDGVDDEGDSCNVDVECEVGTIDADGNLACLGNGGSLAVGTFETSTSAIGLAYEPEEGVNGFCTGVWTATPD